MKKGMLAVMGWNCQQRGEYAQAITHYKKAAERAHVTAEFNLGFMYFSGQGVLKIKLKLKLKLSSGIKRLQAKEIREHSFS